MDNKLNNRVDDVFYPNYDRINKLIYHSIWGLAVK